MAEKKYRVFGHATVTVSMIVSTPDGRELTEEEIYKRAKKHFKGIKSYMGNGGDDKLIGVDGETETIMADEAPIFDDFMLEV